MSLVQYVNNAVRNYVIPAEFRRGYPDGYTARGLCYLGFKTYDKTVLPSGGINPHSEYHAPAIRMIHRAGRINSNRDRTYKIDDDLRATSWLYKIGFYFGVKERQRRIKSREAKKQVAQIAYA